MNSNGTVITDTQVLSYYFKGSMPRPEGIIQISSITAAEFLLMQSQEHNKANYYPILPSTYARVLKAGRAAPNWKLLFDSKLEGKHRTDQLVLNLGPHVPAYIEFGSHAISQLINERRATSDERHSFPPVFAASTSKRSVWCKNDSAFYSNRASNPYRPCPRSQVSR